MDKIVVDCLEKKDCAIIYKNFSLIFQIPGGGNEIVLLGLKCMFSVLYQLNKRESELCAEALTSLLHLLEHIPIDTLANEAYTSVQSMFTMLYQLRMEGLLKFENFDNLNEI